MDVSYLVETAKEMKGCEEGIMQLERSRSVKDLIECFYDNIDYCLANNYPSKEYLLLYQDQLRSEGIYIDDNVVLCNPTRLVLIGDCKVALKLNNWAVCRAYTVGSSRLDIESDSYAITMVDALENSIVKAIANKPSRVIVNLYGNAKSEGASRTIKKNRRTYEL